MATTNNGSNKGMVPEARAAMDRFKMEAANDVAVSLPQKPRLAGRVCFCGCLEIGQMQFTDEFISNKHLLRRWDCRHCDLIPCRELLWIDLNAVDKCLYNLPCQHFNMLELFCDLIKAMVSLFQRSNRCVPLTDGINQCPQALSFIFKVRYQSGKGSIADPSRYRICI